MIGLTRGLKTIKQSNFRQKQQNLIQTCQDVFNAQGPIQVIDKSEVMVTINLQRYNDMVIENIRL